MPTIQGGVACDYWVDENGECGLHFHASTVEKNNARLGKNHKDAMQIKRTLETALFIGFMDPEEYRITLFTYGCQFFWEEIQLVVMLHDQKSLQEFKKLILKIREYTI